MIAVPRLVVPLMPDPDQLPSGPAVWHDTRLLLPAEFPAREWRNIFTGESLPASERDGRTELEAARVFAHFPVALLMSGCRA